MTITKRTEGKGVLGRTVTTVKIEKESTARERKEAAEALASMASTEPFPARAYVQSCKQAAERFLGERGLRFGDAPEHMKPIERDAINAIAQALGTIRYMDEGNINAAVYCAMELSDCIWRIGIREEKSAGPKVQNKIERENAIMLANEYKKTNASASNETAAIWITESAHKSGKLIHAHDTLKQDIKSVFPMRRGRPKIPRR